MIIVEGFNKGLWKGNLTAKDLKVNMEKQKKCIAYMWKDKCWCYQTPKFCSYGTVGVNSVSFKGWVHKSCSGIKGKLNTKFLFQCTTFKSNAMQQLPKATEVFLHQ